jgi:hypothetical protein
VNLQSRFVRALERRYEAAAVRLVSAGRPPDEAHELALEQTKDFGGRALDELRRRSLFPWRDREPGKAEVGHA